jgi:GTP-binding protein EngB required for normal cell division
VARDALTPRLDRLRDAATLLARHGVLAEGVDVDGLLARAAARMRHGTDHTVAALVGSTGSGKSSLLNAVTGADVARVGVTRPTTAIAQAVTVGPTADGLLDDLGITRRHHLDGGEDGGGGALRGLVLLDLPDFDSVTTAHRDEVDRLVGLVDLMVWVTDPQKYADESLHVGYLQRLATHADVMQVVLNKADLLSPGELAACLADLRRLLAADGLPDVTPIAASTVRPDGVDALRGLLAAEVSARQAAVDRLHADVDAAVAALTASGAAPGAVDLGGVHTTLARDLAGAAGVPAVAALVAAQHRRDATLSTGWPPLRWLRRIRRAPLSRLPTAAGSQVARAEVSRALRAAGDHVADGVGPGWAAARAVTRDAVDPVTAALDTGISRDVQVLRRPPRWWGAVGTLQTLLAVVALLGGLWLLGLVLAGSFLLIDTEPLTVRVGALPLPTLLLLGGLAAGALVGLLARLAARVGGRRRAAATTATLTARVDRVAEDVVLDPLRTVLADAATATELLAATAAAPR